MSVSSTIATGARAAVAHPEKRVTFAFLITGLIALLVGVAMLFSGDPRITLWTAGGILGALLILAVAATGIRALARRATGAARGRPVWRWALGAIGGPRETAASVVLSLGLGLSVLAAIGQIDGNLRAAISRDLPEVAPSYFFVDIQKDQMPGFLDRVTGDLEKHEYRLVRDIRALDLLYDKTLAFYDELGLYIAAGAEKLRTNPLMVRRRNDHARTIDFTDQLGNVPDRAAAQTFP